MKKGILDTRFINHWQKYRGFLGFLYYIAPFLLGGVIIFPIILTCINPTIWEQLQKSDFDRVLIPFLVMILLFGVLPAVGVGLLFWKRNQQRFMQITTEQNRYLPFEKRVWRMSEKGWKITLSIMTFLVGISLFISFGLLLGHNAPDYFTYPFQVGIAYVILLFIYQIFMYWWAFRHDEALYIPFVFKALFIINFMAVCSAWIIFFIQFNTFK